MTTPVRNRPRVKAIAAVVSDAAVLDAAVAQRVTIRPSSATIMLCPIVGFADGNAILDASAYQESAALIANVSTVPLTVDDIGRVACVSYLDAAREQSLVLGLVASQDTSATNAASAVPESVSIKSSREIMLKCGDAMIHLTADGLVRIRGTHVVSHAQGTNRLRGGNVQIN